MYRFIFLIVFLLGCSDPSQKSEAKKNATETSFTKADISFRIAPALSLSALRFTELLNLFDKYKGVTDEITLFSQVTHAPLPLDSIKRRAAIYKDRMEEARKRGYKTGINILTTIGHHNEDLENGLQGNYTRMTNIDGKVSRGTLCPNDPLVQEYIKEQYKIITEANPDYIWIDDDVRFGHMPVGYGCFCDNCINIFRNESGVDYSRERLKELFNTGAAQDKLSARSKWLQHNRNTVSRLFQLIEKTVHDIKPEMPLGFMTGDRFFEGYDFDQWAEVLAGDTKKEVMWRPGGGYYTDFNNNELSGKSHDIGRQVSLLPSRITSIQSEIECFPYQRLQKSASMIALEASSHIAAGCTGAAFNVFTMTDEPLAEYEPLIAKLHATRPFFDLMARTLGRTEMTGIQTFWNKNSGVTPNLFSGNWLDMPSPVLGHSVYDIGLPASYSNNAPAVTMLSRNDIFALSAAEIEQLLSTSVYMDAEALQQLNNLGFHELTGFEVAKTTDVDQIEKINDHPLNKNLSGRERDSRQSFYKSQAFALRATNSEAEVLSSLVDYSGKVTGDITMGIFENKKGGRICISGYYPWTFQENLSRSQQMKTVFRWLSKDRLPGYIDSYHKINIWIRKDVNNRSTLAFTNSSFDMAENVILKLQTKSKKIKIFDMRCNETVIPSSGSDGLYEQFIIPEVEPWQMRLIISE